MQNIKLLDCTLRDGGRVIDCKFNDSIIRRMVHSLTASQIDIIEVGFLRDGHNVKYEGNSTFFTDVDQIVPFIPKERNSLYVAFIDFGMFDFESLKSFKGTSIDGIRLGFTKQDFENSFHEIIKASECIKEKGYKLFIQGVNSLNYTDKELLELIDLVNQIEPYSFGIVDTYGAMYEDDVQRLYTLIDHNLKATIAIDFHSHNNYQLSFSFAQEIIKLSNGVRNVIIDTTLQGMGKNAGNTNTELVADFLVRKKGYSYDLSKILELIDVEIYDLYEQYHWGYTPASFVAGLYKSHPNNISYLLSKYNLDTNDMKNVLSMLTDAERERYPYAKIDELYEQYRFKKYDDSSSLSDLRDIIGGRPVLALAPGKTMNTCKAEIEDYVIETKPFIISVNFNSELADISFFGNKKRYFSSCYDGKIKVIVTSDIAYGNENEIVVSALKLRSLRGEFPKSSLFALLYLLNEINVKEISIAGMDGYSEIADNNYASGDLIIKRDIIQIREKNAELQRALDGFIESKNSDCFVRIVTPSIFKIRDGGIV